jgi:hypothetical protein
MLPDSREYRTISETAARVGVHQKTIKRWAEEGIALKDGSRLMLRGDRLPGGWRFTESWLSEFVEALTADRRGRSRAVDVERGRLASSVLEASGW